MPKIDPKDFPRGVAFYSVAEFATLLGFSVSTINRLCDEGHLNFWQVTPRSDRRIPASELERHLKITPPVGTGN